MWHGHQNARCSKRNFSSCRYQKRVSNIIDDVLEWSPSLALSGMMEKQTVFNATDPDSNVTDGSKTTTEQTAQPEDVEGDIITDEHEVEQPIENSEDTDHQ